MFCNHFNITEDKDDALSWKHLQFPSIQTIQNNIEEFCKFLSIFFDEVICFFFISCPANFYCPYQASPEQNPKQV